MDFGEDDFGTKEDVDPAAEFLAREQSVLGDLEAEILPTGTLTATGPSYATAATNALAGDDTLLGGMTSDTSEETKPAGISSVTSFDILQNFGNENMDPVGIIGPPPSRIEPEKIRKWREEQKKRLEEKDREEERKRKELYLRARQELDDWLRQTEESMAKTKAASRQAEKQVSLENGGVIEPGTEWERIAKLCDFNPKSNKSGKDVSRMRSIYLHLKQNPIPMRNTV